MDTFKSYVLLALNPISPVHKITRRYGKPNSSRIASAFVVISKAFQLNLQVVQNVPFPLYPIDVTQ